MRTDLNILIKALRILSREIQSGDGVANAAIAEGADRLEELQAAFKIFLLQIEEGWTDDFPLEKLVKTPEFKAAKEACE